jgi:hypothetical protein
MKKLQALVLSCSVLRTHADVVNQWGTATNHSEDIESRVNSILSRSP